MAFIPNNSAGNIVTSNANIFFEKAVMLGGVFGFNSEYISPAIRIQGMNKITLSANGSADGTAPTYPDSTVGSALIALEVASGNAGEFEAGLNLSYQKIAEYTVSLTDSATFDVPALYEALEISAKYIRMRCNFLPNQATGNYAKFYARIHASA
jgi:hypothetical protein